MRSRQMLRVDEYSRNHVRCLFATPALSTKEQLPWLSVCITIATQVEQAR